MLTFKNKKQASFLSLSPLSEQRAVRFLPFRVIMFIHVIPEKSLINEPELRGRNTWRLKSVYLLMLSFTVVCSLECKIVFFCLSQHQFGLKRMQSASRTLPNCHLMRWDSQAGKSFTSRLYIPKSSRICQIDLRVREQ